MSFDDSGSAKEDSAIASEAQGFRGRVLVPRVVDSNVVVGSLVSRSQGVHNLPRCLEPRISTHLEPPSGE